MTEILSSHDAEIGMKLLIETMKRQHVQNFDMQQKLIQAVDQSNKNEDWKAKVLKESLQA